VLCSVSRESSAEGVSLAARFKTGLRLEAGGDGRTDRQASQRCRASPGKVLHHRQLPAAATPVKPALPYRVWHQNEQRGAWLLHDDSDVSSHPFFLPHQWIFWLLAPEASLLFYCSYRTGISAFRSVFTHCVCKRYRLKGRSPALHSSGTQSPRWGG